MPSLQAEEAAALEALAEQGQTIALDQAVPSVQLESPATPTAEAPAAEVVPDQPATPAETQLLLMGDEAPQSDRANAATAQADAIAEQQATTVEAPEADRVAEAPTVVDPASDQFEAPIEPSSTEESLSNENAAI